jgi:hypothetical protein
METVILMTYFCTATADSKPGGRSQPNLRHAGLPGPNDQGGLTARLALLPLKASATDNPDVAQAAGGAAAICHFEFERGENLVLTHPTVRGLVI